MADDILDLTRERFNRIDAKLDRILDVQGDMLLRLGSLEQKVAFMATDIARIDGRLDAMNKRLDRIEKRLDLVQA